MCQPRLGLRTHRFGQHSGRQRRRSGARHYWSREQGTAAHPRALGRVACVGVGCGARARLSRDGCSRRRKACRHRRRVALWKGEHWSNDSQRFAMGFIGSSGKGGATLHRRNWGPLPAHSRVRPARAHAARTRATQLMHDAKLTVHVDAAGNIYRRRAGTLAKAKPDHLWFARRLRTRGR